MISIYRRDLTPRTVDKHFRRVYTRCMGIESIQEGEEWIARLRKELDALTADLFQYREVLSVYTIANIEYAIDKIANYIAEISIEIGLMGEDYESGDED